MSVLELDQKEHEVFLVISKDELRQLVQGQQLLLMNCSIEKQPAIKSVLDQLNDLVVRV